MGRIKSRMLYTDLKATIKNGWLNIAKAKDFSDLNANKLLLTAAKEVWSTAGVNFLINDLNALTKIQEMIMVSVHLCRLV